MADINTMWPAKILHNASCKKYGVDNEATWVEQQYAKLSVRKQNKWSLNRIRKYLLENFCEPKAVEAKIAEIMQVRYKKSMETGIPMKV